MLSKSKFITRSIQMISKMSAKPIDSLSFKHIKTKTSNTFIPTTTGNVKVTIFHPTTNKSKKFNDDKRPVYINFHGGGFVVRHPEMDDHICRYLTENTGCFVVNVDYDVAPQKMFPVAPNQAYEVTRWVLDVVTAESYGWDTEKLIIGGQSAGGNLATGASISSIQHASKLPILQILVYPFLDFVTPPEDKIPLIDKPIISLKVAKIFNQVYLKETDKGNPLATPICFDRLSEMPKTLIITAEHDVLKKEAETYGASLKEAGVDVEICEIKNVDHIFTHNGPYEKAIEAFEKITQKINDSIN